MHRAIYPLTRRNIAREKQSFSLHYKRTSLHNLNNIPPTQPDALIERTVVAHCAGGSKFKNTRQKSYLSDSRLRKNLTRKIVYLTWNRCCRSPVLQKSKLVHRPFHFLSFFFSCFFPGRLPREREQDGNVWFKDKRWH